jgi:polyvinyl alcohol dehydrogenase (cytochrome)
MTAERVLAALESGAMISMASRNTAAERRAIAQYVTGKSLSKKDVDMTPAPQAMCPAAGNYTNPLAGPIWNGWGDNTFNTRFQEGSTAGFTAADVPRLKVKWAFGFPGDLDANAQPTIVGGRVFVGSQGAKVYSLSADTGCIHWFVQATGAVRGAVTRKLRVARHGY